MAEVYFKSTADAISEEEIATGKAQGQQGAVNEQHPLPVQIAFKSEDTYDFEAVNEGKGLPVYVIGAAPAASESGPTDVFRIPGIGTGAAYASADAFGTAFALRMPYQKGTISNFVFLDYDAEGLPKELVLFSAPIAGTADNAAFAPTDAELRTCIGVVATDIFYAYSVNQVGQGTPALAYTAPNGTLYGQFVTRGADNIAAGSIPEFFLQVVA